MKRRIVYVAIIICLLSCKKNLSSPNTIDKKKQITTLLPKDGIKFKPNAIINYKYLDKISLLNWQGEKIGFIQNNAKTEDFVSIKIEKDSLEYFYVHSKAEMTDVVKTGWLKKANYIGTYARNYGKEKILNLYTKPNLNSEIKNIITGEIIELYTVKNLEKDWVFVEISDKGKNYSGWLEPNMQCPNSYSMCN